MHAMFIYNARVGFVDFFKRKVKVTSLGFFGTFAKKSKKTILEGQ